MAFEDSVLSMRDEARRWCAGRNWLVRLPLLLFFVYVLVRHMLEPEYASVLAPLNLGIHELGHFVFGFAGTFMGVLGGTLLQTIIPVIGVFNFYRQEDFFALALMFGWLATNFFGIARYAADAGAMELPLVSPFGGDTVIHDWNYMLGALGLLGQERLIGRSFWIIGVFFMLVCLCAGGWLLWQMARPGAEKKDSQPSGFTQF